MRFVAVGDMVVAEVAGSWEFTKPVVSSIGERYPATSAIGSNTVKMKQGNGGSIETISGVDRQKLSVLGEGGRQHGAGKSCSGYLAGRGFKLHQCM